MKKQTTAFTLIELLVVIVIIGILATVSTATFGGASSKALIAKYRAERVQAAKERYEECLSVRSESECFPQSIVLVGRLSFLGELGLHMKSPDENNSGVVIENLGNSHLFTAYAPSFSPDGRYIVYDGSKGGSFALQKKDVLTNGAAIAITSQRSRSPVYSPDGKYIYYGTSSGDIYRKDAEDETTDNGEVVANLPGINALQIHPDGRSWLYVGDCEGYTRVLCSASIGSANGKALTTTSNAVWLARYSPDGEYIIYTNPSDGMRMYKKDASTLSNGTAINNRPAFGIAISADMKDIYYYANIGAADLYKKSFDDTTDGSKVFSMFDTGPIVIFPW